MEHKHAASSAQESVFPPEWMGYLGTVPQQQMHQPVLMAAHHGWAPHHQPIPQWPLYATATAAAAAEQPVYGAMLEQPHLRGSATLHHIPLVPTVATPTGEPAPERRCCQKLRAWRKQWIKSDGVGYGQEWQPKPRPVARRERLCQCLNMACLVLALVVLCGVTWFVVRRYQQAKPKVALLCSPYSAQQQREQVHLHYAKQMEQLLQSDSGPGGSVCASAIDVGLWVQHIAIRRSEIPGAPPGDGPFLHLLHPGLQLHHDERVTMLANETGTHCLPPVKRETKRAAHVTVLYTDLVTLAPMQTIELYNFTAACVQFYADVCLGKWTCGGGSPPRPPEQTV